MNLFYSFCHNNKLTITGQTCPPITTTTTTTTTPIPTPHPPVCNKTGWTQWMSSQVPSTTNLGDIESYGNLRYAYQFCKKSQVTNIQCKEQGKKLGEHSGQATTCTIADAFACYNAKQKNPPCRNYEVRFFCQCEGRTDFFTAW
jgi:hypothetical protein